MKKTYIKPKLKTKVIKLGVFGDYGRVPSNDKFGLDKFGLE